MISFTGEIVIPKGIVTLLVSIGESHYKEVYMVNFLVLDNLRAYNIIFGRPFVATTKVIVSMPYYKNYNAKIYYNHRGILIDC